MKTSVYLAEGGEQLRTEQTGNKENCHCLQKNEAIEMHQARMSRKKKKQQTEQNKAKQNKQTTTKKITQLSNTVFGWECKLQLIGYLRNNNAKRRYLFAVVMDRNTESPVRKLLEIYPEVLCLLSKRHTLLVFHSLMSKSGKKYLN